MLMLSLSYLYDDSNKPGCCMLSNDIVKNFEIRVRLYGAIQE